MPSMNQRFIEIPQSTKDEWARRKKKVGEMVNTGAKALADLPFKSTRITPSRGIENIAAAAGRASVGMERRLRGEPDYSQTAPTIVGKGKNFKSWR